MKILSWNIGGMNSPQKRSKVFHYVKKFSANVICLQETHIKEKDIRLLKNRKLGNEYISANEKKKNGVVFYVDNRLKAKIAFKDKEGRYLGLEVTLQNGKCLMVGIYAPLDKKDQFYTNLNEELSKVNYEKTLIMGDWNGVVNPEIDRKSERKIKKTQGKLPKAFKELTEEQTLQDVWRFKYRDARDFTFFSGRHKSFSRIDMFYASKTLCKDILRMDSEPRTISDHSPLTVLIKLMKNEYAWRLNEALLYKEEIVEKARENIKLFFEENLKPDIDITTVWEASKAYMRGFFMQQNFILKKKKERKTELDV